MGQMLRFYNILGAAILLIASPAVAAAPFTPLHFNGLYEVNLGSVRFAKVGIEVEQESDHYSIVMDIAVTGIIKLFTRHTSHTTVDGSGHHFSYPERAYESRYRIKKKRKYVHMVYDAGTVKSQTLEPPENPAKRPPVSADLKKGSYDPLSFILKMRQEMIEASKNGKTAFSVSVYDGRRLTHANFSDVGKKTIRLDGKKTPVVFASVKRELVAGFTASELEDFNPSEPALSIYFSDDERMMPLRLETGFWLGTLSATLVKECRTGESCLLGLKE